MVGWSWYSHNHTVCSSLQDGQSSLMRASVNGHEGVVRILLSACAKVDLQDYLVSSTSPAQGHVVTYKTTILKCKINFDNLHCRYLAQIDKT